MSSAYVGDAGRTHPTGGGELRDLADVHLGPPAAWAAGDVLLEVVGRITRPALSRDPPEAQSDVDRLVVRQGRHTGALLGELQPDTGGVVDVVGQPGLEGRGVAERDHLGAVGSGLGGHGTTLVGRPESDRELELVPFRG